MTTLTMEKATQYELRLAERMSRLGTETAFEVLNKARALERQGKSIIHLEIGEPDFDTPKDVVEAGVKALKAGCSRSKIGWKNGAGVASVTAMNCGGRMARACARNAAITSERISGGGMATWCRPVASVHKSGSAAACTG